MSEFNFSPGVLPVAADWGADSLVREHCERCAGKLPFGVSDRQCKLFGLHARLCDGCHRAFDTDPKAIEHLRAINVGSVRTSAAMKAGDLAIAEAETHRWMDANDVARAYAVEWLATSYKASAAPPSP